MLLRLFWAIKYVFYGIGSHDGRDQRVFNNHQVTCIPVLVDFGLSWLIFVLPPPSTYLPSSLSTKVRLVLFFPLSFRSPTYLIMTVLELLASLIDVWLPSHLSGEFVVAFLLSLCCLLTSFMCHASIWISAWLPSHLSGEFVVAFLLSLRCLLTSFMCHASIRISAPQSWAFYHPKFIHCRTDLLHEVKRKAFGLYCNRVMKDLETFNSRWCTGRTRLRGWAAYYICGIRYVLLRTWLAYLLTTILGTRCQISLMNDTSTVDSGKWVVGLNIVNNPVSDNSSSIRCLFSRAQE